MAETHANLDAGRTFFSGSTGKWAGEQFMRAFQEGKPISPAQLRTNAILRNEEWVALDTEVIQGAQERMRGVADLISAGLTTNIPNGLGKTVLNYDKAGDMDPAIVSLDGITRSENDRMEYERAGLPLPIAHKDFYLNLRALEASRNGAEPLDTTYSRVAGRKVGEAVEDMLFNGGKTFGGLTVYGYTTHPDRNTANYGTGGPWSSPGKTGDQILTDLFTGITALETDGHYGPYWLYIGGTAANLKLAQDYKAATDSTIQERLSATARIAFIGTSSKLAADEILMVQPSSDVVKLIQGEPLQTVQWDVHGGFQINFKAFTIQVPLIRSDVDGNSGIFHMYVP
jgi:uncharacterized linocin/CFP29 family protein